MKELFNSTVVKTTTGRDLESSDPAEKIIIIASGKFPRLVLGYFPLDGAKFCKGDKIRIGLVEADERGAGSPYRIEPLQ